MNPALASRIGKEVRTMQWEFITALVFVIPIIAFPALLWHLDIGRNYAAIRETRRRRAAYWEERFAAEAEQREAVRHGST